MYKKRKPDYQNTPLSFECPLKYFKFAINNSVSDGIGARHRLIGISCRVAKRSVNFSLKISEKTLFGGFVRQRVVLRARLPPRELSADPVRQVRPSPGNSRFRRYEFIKSNFTIVPRSSCLPLRPPVRTLG